MANTTFANLKINALRRCGNYYNANDTTMLSLAGGLINEALAQIYLKIKKSPFCYDTANTTNTVASQAYIALADTDIVQILQVYQKVTDTKLTYIPYSEFIALAPDTTNWSGVPEVFWSATQAVDVSGQNIWTLWFAPTPSSAIAIYYDYMKSLALSADGDFCKLPQVYDRWIYAEFKPIFLEVVAPKDTNRILSSRAEAERIRNEFAMDINLHPDKPEQMASFLGSQSLGSFPVSRTHT